MLHFWLPFFPVPSSFLIRISFEFRGFEFRILTALCPLSSDLCLLSSDLCLLSSDLCLLTSSFPV